VICPSEDVRRRLARYGFDGNAIVVPHEPVAGGRGACRHRPLNREARCAWR